MRENQTSKQTMVLNEDMTALVNDSEGVSDSEWKSIPVTFGVQIMARLIHSNKRYVQNHAEELGGRKIGGRWLFSKIRTAELLGM